MKDGSKKGQHTWGKEDRDLLSETDRKSAALKQQICRMLCESDGESPEVLREAAQLLEQLADEIEKGHLKKGDSAGAYGLYAVQYIRSHFKEQVRIAELAAYIGISRGYLTRLCRQTVGMSPKEYLLECRMEYARKQLLHTNAQVRDIAADCGYDDPLTFSRTFSRKTGMSPSSFRKRGQNPQ